MASQAKIQIKQVFKDAMTAHAKGQSDLARRLYKKLLAHNDRLAEVHFQLGRLEVEQGRPKRALVPLRKARNLRPDEPAVWSMMLTALMALEDQSSVETLLEQSQKAPLTTKDKSALQRRALGGNRSGTATTGGIDPREVQAVIEAIARHDVASARPAALAFRSSHPNTALFHALVSACDAALGDLDAARQGYRRAIELDSNYLEAYLHLGEIETSRHNTDAARPLLERALELGPENAIAMKFRGIVHGLDSEFISAIQKLEAARRELPDDPQLLCALAEARLALEENDLAVEVLKDAEAAGLEEFEVLKLSGVARSQQGDVETALVALKKAISIRPGDLDAHAALAQTYVTAGDFDSANLELEEYLNLDKSNGGAFRLWSAVNKVRPDDAKLSQMEELFEKDNARAGTRPELAFALAKAMEDINQYDRVFQFLNEGNHLLNDQFPWDAQTAEAEIPKILQAYEDLTKDTLGKTQHSGIAPIFVTGLPRSGTTLVEQIISSHSQVTGGGELGIAIGPLRDLCDRASADDRALSGGEINSAGIQIALAAESRALGKRSLTDKAIATYRYIGLVRAALPNARIIVVRRDPRDACLSMYKNYFRPGTHRYTTDLVALADRAVFFDNCIKAWRSRCPDDFYEISYEALTADPETEAKALIAACGLEWEQGCLDFHKSDRQVRTLSFYQARQPMYRSSVAAWERYAEDLKPLTDRLKKAGLID